jgi:hypothetical protein
MLHIFGSISFLIEGFFTFKQENNLSSIVKIISVIRLKIDPILKYFNKNVVQKFFEFK